MPAMEGMWVQSLGREDAPGEGNGNPLQYSCLGNPWTEEPGGLESTGSQRVSHDLATKQQQIACHHPYQPHRPCIALLTQNKKPASEAKG